MLDVVCRSLSLRLFEKKKKKKNNNIRIGEQKACNIIPKIKINLFDSFAESLLLSLRWNVINV